MKCECGHTPAVHSWIRGKGKHRIWITAECGHDDCKCPQYEPRRTTEILGKQMAQPAKGEIQ